jgi:hypothetical protein
MKEKPIFITAFVLLIIIGSVLGENSTGNGEVNLTTWDETDNSTKRSGWSTYFYANYTNASSGSPISDGSCEIRFQNYTLDYGSWQNMAYNSTYSRFQYNRTFDYKGSYFFNVNCSNSSSLTIQLEENYTITNSVPEISKEDGADWINFDGDDQNHDSWKCTEDSICYYNFTSNITEDDINDVLSYSNGSENTTLTDFTVDSEGILTINITHSNNTGAGKKVELKVKDSDPDSLWQSALLEVDVTEVNDAPYFVGLYNWTMNVSETFTENANVSDEEFNVEYTLNITFLECATIEWSDRNSTNCTLFNESGYIFDAENGTFILNFTPSRNDVGSYIINFSATDNSTLGNKTGSQIVNFTVQNVNQAPVFTYICDNERNTTEDSEFTCWINASDIDEIYNLTFSSNNTWFTFNATGSNSVTKPCNSSTDYNSSAMVNFTAADSQVGNWSVNITVLDIGEGYGAPKSNSTIIKFLIENVEDPVYLNQPENKTVYEDYTFYVNATDEDLLVPDPTIKDEVLTFYSNTSWISVSPYSFGSDYTVAKVDIDFDAGLLGYGAGNHTVKINVTDTGGNSDEKYFVIGLGEDEAPNWSATMDDSFIIYEGNETYLNFSENVSDDDGDPIYFSGVSSNSFPSFSINSLGIINFTPSDTDVGFHNITINATDNKLNSFKSFNFTVLNVNDEPYVRPFTPTDVKNASLDGQNINCTEDNYTTIWIWTEDDDFRIPEEFQNFYNESHVFDLIIEGPNTALFNFSADPAFPIGNSSKFNAYFTPRKADVGYYNITINVSDEGNFSYSVSFNLSVEEISHGPEMMNLTNQTGTINENLYYRINATDIEDGNSTTPGNYNFTFSYSMNQGADIFSSSFNQTTGEFNITFSSNQEGVYHLNITVNDSGGLEDKDNFWIYVYGSPSINYPEEGYEYSLLENITSQLVFMVNDSVGNNLTYEIYIENSNQTNTLRYNLSYYGNNTNFTWQFTPNFTDETYGQKRNLTLLVYPAGLPALNDSRTWNITINHTNAPVEFIDNIDDNEDGVVYTEDYTVNLSAHFSDADYFDFNYNQTINFTVWSNESVNGSSSAISWSVSGFTLTLSASSAVTESLTVNASDMENSSAITNATSNSFLVKFITPPKQPTPQPVTGGGGGSSGETPKPISLKLIFPDRIEVGRVDRIELPITVKNTGSMGLSEIDLNSSFKKNNMTIEGIDMKFTESSFTYLGPGQETNTTLTIVTNTEETGDYEIIVNGSVKDPKYSEYSILHLKITESNESETLEKLLFTEEFIAENPECIEIKEIVNDAWEFYDKGQYENSLSKAREAIDSCRYAISQPAMPREKESFIKDLLYKYTSIAFLVLIGLMTIYYLYHRAKIKRK